MKNTVRKELLRIRDEIPFETRIEKDALIKWRLFSLPEFLSGRKLLLYASFRSEVETLSIIRASLKMWKQIVLPKVDREGHTLKLYAIEGTDELSPGYMGILEPFKTEGRSMNLDDIDAAVVPGAGFDYSGNRLGYGGGYYDMLLAGRRRIMPLIAVAYEEQLVDKIPSEKHDVRVDIIVTDQRVIRI
ncbi:MAG TPA: 5-formyltetrahydrofolate cyclo-ligase [Thermodesulfovibrionales bacterium]|nr:5-formyltetrahydrofolate cyclo-ligase [Thermodesulfovibrionales bacterium]